MNMAVASLVALAAAIVLGFVKKVNVGICSIALAYLIGIKMCIRDRYGIVYIVSRITAAAGRPSACRREW